MNTTVTQNISVTQNIVVERLVIMPSRSSSWARGVCAARRERARLERAAQDELIVRERVLAELDAIEHGKLSAVERGVAIVVYDPAWADLLARIEAVGLKSRLDGWLARMNARAADHSANP